MTQERREPAPAEPLAPEMSLFARIKAGAGVITVALVLLFMAQNLQSVQMHFLWFGWRTRLLWALLVAAAFGALITIVTGALVRRRERPARPPR